MPFWSPYFIKYFGAEFTLFAFFAFLVTGKLTGTTLLWSSNAIVQKLGCFIIWVPPTLAIYMHYFT